MKKVILFICVLFFWGLAYGQQPALAKVTITGKVIDSLTQQPIEFATISFKNEKGLVGTTSDKNGDFSMSITSGIYTIKVEFLSYTPQLFINKELKNDTRLDTIHLSFSSENLEEVEIVALKDLMEFKLDKKIYHASKDIANEGGTAIDVLNNTPSVSVDNNGNVIMKGSNATVLVDGKPLFGLDGDTDILSSIPSNSIENIEIITRSAKYDAEGDGGIINIVTKKSKDSGLGGSINTYLGTPDNNGVSTFLNKKNDKVNLFSTISFNNRVRVKNTTLKQTFFDNLDNTTGFFNEISEDENQRNSFLFSLGSDFYINSNNTLTTSFLINTNNKNYRTNLSLDDFDTSNTLTQSATRNVKDFEDTFRMEAFLNYTTKFDDKGQQLSFDFKYNNTVSEDDTNIIERISIPVPEVINQNITKDQNLDNYLFQLDYTLPFSETKKLELGYKGTLRFYENDYIISQFGSVGFTVFDDIIDYDEKVHAFYGQYSASHGNLSYSLGLRTETSDVTFIGENSSSNNFFKNYTDIFPSAMLGYEFKNGSYLSASYSKSIDRPKISQLNPFSSLNNERFQSVGNPELNPFYTNYFELVFNHSFEKVSLVSSFFVNNAEDQFLSIIENTGQLTANGDEIYRRIFINSGDNNKIGLDFDIAYKPFKGLRLNAYVAPFHQKITNAINSDYNNTNTFLVAQGSALISLNNGLRIMVSNQYNSSEKTGLTTLSSVNFTSATISKRIFKKKGTLTFKAIDIFKSKRFAYKSLEANTQTLRNIFYQNQYSLSFTYRINQKRRSLRNRSKDVDKDELEDKQDEKQ